DWSSDVCSSDLIQNTLFTIMFRKDIYISFLAIVLLLASGCASLMMPEQKAPLITSAPSGAGVYDSRDSLIGITPFKFKKKPRSNDSYMVKKEGFVSRPLT